MNVEEYLKSIMPSRSEVDRFLSTDTFEDPAEGSKGWTYDAGLGWVLKDSVRGDGLDGSRTFYRYEPGGCRKRINCADVPCRIHVYGNSFTHCDQVNDGETWEEYLAAHIREPIMNFGVGGYGVYQAYRRMIRQEEKNPAEYVILNIWDDDHFRNLDAWRSIRFGCRTSCGFTLPHLKVELTSGGVVEAGNICKTAEDVYRMTDPDFVVETFRDDVVLKDMQDMAWDMGEGGVYCRPWDMSPELVGSALLASRRVIEWFEEETAKRGQKFMLILSHSAGGIRRDLDEEPRWDESLLDTLEGKPYPVFDLRDAHAAEFSAMNTNLDDYLNRYYIGHYSPAGNHFFARTLKETIVGWLDPKPGPYTVTKS